MSRLSAPSSRLLFAVLAAAAMAFARPAAARDCAATPEMLDLGASLPATRKALAEGKEVRIVAFGSSSTEGYGASPQNSYPSALNRYLMQRLPKTHIAMMNKGIGGQDVREMRERIQRDVIDEKPQLVIWQVGTNAARSRMPLEEFEEKLGRGVQRMIDAGIDVVLMDLQFAPDVIALPDEDAYNAVMRKVSREKKIGLFRRFDIMRHWSEKENLPWAYFLNRDGLHLNDYGYKCMGKLVATSIQRAVGMKE